MDVYGLPVELQEKILLEFSFEDLLIKSIKDNHFTDFISDEAFLAAHMSKNHQHFRTDQNLFEQIMKANNLTCYMVPITFAGVPYYDQTSDEIISADHWGHQAVDMRDPVMYDIPPFNLPDEYLKAMKNYLESSLIQDKGRVVIIKYRPSNNELMILLYSTIDIDPSDLAENIYGNECAPSLGRYRYEDAIHPIAEKYELNIKDNMIDEIKQKVPNNRVNFILRKYKQIQHQFTKYPEGFEIAILPKVDDAYINNSLMVS